MLSIVNYIVSKNMYCKVVYNACLIKIVLKKRKTKILKLGNCGKPDDPNSILNSSVNHLGHVTSEGLMTVKIFRVKWGM